MEGYFEKFRYDKGNIEELKDRALRACAFLSGLKGWDSRANEIAEGIMESEDETEISQELQFVCSQILKNTSDGDSLDWNELYTALFGNGLFIMGSDYIPQSDEVPRIVRQCIRDKVRIKVDLPEGFNS